MKTIIWDVDDVLNNLMEEWFENHWLPSHHECRLKYGDLVENPPDKLLGTTLNEYRKSLDEFRKISGSQFKPTPEVLDWFKTYGSKYRHIALSAVPLSLANISAAWVYQNFGNWIRSFNIVPSPRDTDPVFNYDLSKKDFLSWFGKGDFFIDDNLLNIKEARKIGIQSFVFPRPWNEGELGLTELLKQL